MMILYLLAGFVGALVGVGLSVFLGYGWMIGVLAYVLGGAAGVLVVACGRFLSAWRGARRYRSKSQGPADRTAQAAADSVASDKTSSR